ncbi:unnamed protein product [Linum trigynum]|uniref:Transposase MuDR plant domain-containing protein n=1 Tax=Linum trigynum TaxID=586398 RepID=A0AAV2FRL1_9ROSI
MERRSNNLMLEEDESSDDDSEEEDGLAGDNGQNGDNGVNEGNGVNEPAEVPPMQEARPADSNHSSYRLSEDSNHVRANLSDSEGGDIFDDAPQCDPHCNHKVLQFVPRMKFVSPKEFKAAVVHHSVAHGAGLRWIRVEKSRREVKCKDKNCKWRVYASWFRRNQSFMVRKTGLPHSCARQLRVNQVTAHWIAQDMLERFRINPEWAPTQIMAEVKLKQNIEVARRTCYRAKISAIKMLSGSLVEDYHMVRSYLGELKKRDPRGNFILGVEPHPSEDKVYFQRFYIGFSALRDGFLEACRPMFGLDGCFLKGEIKGMLLTAVGKDSNNQMYPIAWAVVEGENTNSWMWFVNTLAQDLELRDGRGWSVISDQ